MTAPAKSSKDPTTLGSATTSDRPSIQNVGSPKMSNTTSLVSCQCGKSFKTSQALMQHTRDSPRHRQSTMPRLSASGKGTFKSEEALPQHQRDLPIPLKDCVEFVFHFSPLFPGGFPPRIVERLLTRLPIFCRSCLSPWGAYSSPGEYSFRSWGRRSQRCPLRLADLEEGFRKQRKSARKTPKNLSQRPTKSRKILKLHLLSPQRE
jgi:hypothetical protein